MFVLLFNLFWMTWNILLGYIALLFCIAGYHFKSKLARIVSFIGWILFLPNTIYMLTDINHLKRQLFIVSDPLTKTAVFVQYALLFSVGVILFVYNLLLFESILKKEGILKSRTYLKIMLICLNFIVAFGVVMGRVQRTNSWHIVTNTGKVVKDALSIFTTPHLLIYVIFFGILCNILYFTLTPILLRTNRKRK